MMTKPLTRTSAFILTDFYLLKRFVYRRRLLGKPNPESPPRDYATQPSAPVSTEPAAPQAMQPPPRLPRLSIARASISNISSSGTQRLLARRSALGSEVGQIPVDEGRIGPPSIGEEVPRSGLLSLNR